MKSLLQLVGATEEQQAFYASMHAEWLCVEWSPGLQDLGDKFGVEHIPGLVVVGRDGSPAIRDARQALLDLMGKEEVRRSAPPQKTAGSRR